MVPFIVFHCFDFEAVHILGWKLELKILLGSGKKGHFPSMGRETKASCEDMQASALVMVGSVLYDQLE